MSPFQEKTTRHTKRQKTHFKETEQASEPQSDMSGIIRQGIKKMINKGFKGKSRQHAKTGG